MTYFLCIKIKRKNRIENQKTEKRYHVCTYIHHVQQNRKNIKEKPIETRKPGGRSNTSKKGGKVQETS
jgi:hypothetical protein